MAKYGGIIDANDTSRSCIAQRRTAKSRLVRAVFSSTILVAFVGCSDAGTVDEQGAPSTTAEPVRESVSTSTELAAEPVWRIVRVVDGDTIIVAGSAGEEKIRIIGVNTPEDGECFSAEATQELVALVRAQDLLLIEDQSDVDQYGRSLRYVETADGLDVGAELVAGGFAIARRYPPDEARADLYSDLQEEARLASRGLWAPDACGASELGASSIAVDINPDAPGDDGLNLNGEWVRFTNTSAEDVDLAGWVVADESASHRYTFGDLVLAPGSSVMLLTGCGTDSRTERYWCADGSAIWNNSGDTVFLRDPNGNIVVSLSYGDAG